MIDLTDEVNLLEVADIPDTLSEQSAESDGVVIIREYHPIAPTIDQLLSSSRIGHQIHMSQDLPKIRYASSGVRDLITRHLTAVQSGDPLPPPAKKKPSKGKKANLEIVSWYEIIDEGKTPEPVIPILIRDDAPNPLINLYTERWFESREEQTGTKVVILTKAPKVQRRNTPPAPLPVKKLKLASPAAPTVDEFLQNLLADQQKPGLGCENGRHALITLDIAPPTVQKSRELTPAQQDELEKEVRRYNRNNINEFLSKLLEIDLFAEESEDNLKEIPIDFPSGKTYIDTFKSNFYSEMRAIVHNSAFDLDNRVYLDLRFQKERDGFAYLLPCADLHLPSFRSYDLILCVYNDRTDPWKPDKPITPPTVPYFLGVVERLKENILSTPVIRAKYTDTLRALFSASRELNFFLGTFLGAVTLMRELRAIQLAEFTNLFPLLLSPRDEVADAPLTIPDVFFTNLPAVYNLSQIGAITEVCTRGAGISLIQGPPGTGKTHTILGLISAFLCSRERWEKKPAVLVCAPSNNAVDEIALRVVKDGLFTEYGDRRRDVICVRVGSQRNDEFGPTKKQPQEVSAITLRELVGERMGVDGRRDRGAAISALSGELAKVGRNLSEARAQGMDAAVISLMKQQRSLNEKIARERHEKSIESEKRKLLEVEILNSADIIFTTLAGARSKEMEKLSGAIDFLIIDEACQSVEPTALIPLQKQTRMLVLVGDPMQLPATVSSQKAGFAGYNRSLFERLMLGGMKVTMLTEQYRMAPYIRAFPSQQFYSERLTDARSVLTRRKPDWLPQVPLAFFNLLRSEEVKDSKSASFGNPAEAEFISEMAFALYQRFDALNIAVISPYRKQVQLLRDRLHTIVGVEVDTVDGFQGREKDAVIISTVRSHESLGFLTDSRRLNVAITRAKFGLWVVGCAKTLRRGEKWGEFLRHCDENGNLKTCQEFRDVASLFRSRKGA